MRYFKLIRPRWPYFLGWIYSFPENQEPSLTEWKEVTEAEYLRQESLKEKVIPTSEQIAQLQSANAELLEALKAAANSKELTEKEITELAGIGSQHIYLDVQVDCILSEGGVLEIIKRYEAMRQQIVTETILKYTK